MKLRFIHWKENDMYIGYLEEYPDYRTQGEHLDELKEHLLDLYADLSSGAIPAVRKADELEVV